jgi:hypothetical protein
VTEAGIGRSQNALTKHTAMGVHQREGSIVADRADVTKVIREALQLRHESAQPTRSLGHLDPKRRLDCLSKSERVGNGAVAGDAASELGSSVEIGTSHQALNSLVNVAKPFLKPNHRLAICREAEMAGLDDAGMDRTDRDLVHAFAFGG